MKKMVNGVVMDMTAEEVAAHEAEAAAYRAGQSQRDHDKALRTRAARYHTESDIHFMESIRKRAMGDAAGADAAEALGVAAATTIQAEVTIPAVV